MSDHKREAVIHATNVDRVEQAKFSRELTLNEIKRLLDEGAPGQKLLLSKAEDRDYNVVIEYK